MRKEKINKNIIDNFSNLAPISNGQNQEVYIELLEKGVDDESVKNIALTGSYGSGKSSILKRFLNKLPPKEKNKYLEISLANFDKNSKKEEKEQSIERSILQQIFYKVSKDKVPYSKLNRTENKDSKELWSYAFMFFVWIVSFFVYKHRDAIHKTLETYDINIQTILLLGSIIPLLVTTLVIIYLILRGIGKIKLNKLSFQGVNLDLEENKEGSLLNQYIDEILYFFEATDYEVVVIEDLDRHEVTNIFQKLREINILLNSYEKIKNHKKITFIYAVKDSIFTGEERTKFFEMVIPVIPIVNTSNAKDILINKFEESGLLSNIGKAFLKDISYYIKDLRQLTNIFNEYLVYHKSINTKNQKDLFSMIIYKNFFPQDFALLHNREGELYRIFTDEKEALRKNTLNSLTEKLNVVQSKLDAVENEELESVEELKMLFLAKIIIQHNNFENFSYRNSKITQAQLIGNEEAFNMYLNGGQLPYYYNSYNTTSANFSNYYNEYNRKLEIIKNKVLEKEGKLTKELHEGQQQIRDCKYALMTQLLKDDLSMLDIKDIENVPTKIWSNEEKSNWKLIKHLIKHGYINEKYKAYISYFHEGDLTQSDHDLIVAIKDNESKNFDYKLDNIASVIEELDAKDFETDNIINLDIAKYFFDHTTKHKDKRMFFLKTIFRDGNQEFNFILVEKNIKDENFLLSFLKEILLDENMTLASISNIFKSDTSLLQEILIFILDNLKKLELSDDDISTLSLLLKEYLVDIYENLNEKDTVQAILLKHDVKFDEITKKLIKVTPLFMYIYENNLYRFTIDNIRSIIEAIPSKNEWDRDLFYKAHLTTVRENYLSYMVEYIDSDIDGYYENVINELEENNLESEETLVYLLTHKNLDDAYKQNIIEKSENRISNILNIENKDWWANLFENNLLESNWNNVFNYYIEKNELDESLFNFLNDEENAKELSKAKRILSKKYFEEHEEFDEKGSKLIKKILEKNEFDNDSYKILIESYNFWYSDLELSTLDDDKINILIDTGRLMPKTEVYHSIAEQCVECAVKFMERYIDKYPEDELDITFESEVFVGLLNSTNLTKENKRFIIEKSSSFNFDQLKQIAQFYMDINEQIPNDIFQELFYNNSIDLENRVSILAYNIDTIDILDVTNYLDELGKPYSEILERTLKNLKVDFEENIWTIVQYMSKEKWIGKVNKSKKGDEIIINRRESEIV